MIYIICACNQTYSIGLDNKLLYHLKKDLARFKTLTTDNIVLFGRKTYDSLPIQPLPNRQNIILSRKNKVKYNGQVFVEHDFKRLLNYYKNTGQQEKHLFICGGEEIYKIFLPYADKVLLTYIYDNEQGDTRFPYAEMLNYFKESDRVKNEENGLKFDFIEYSKKTIG